MWGKCLSKCHNLSVIGYGYFRKLEPANYIWNVSIGSVVGFCSGYLYSHLLKETPIQIEEYVLRDRNQRNRRVIKELQAISKSMSNLNKITGPEYVTYSSFSYSAIRRVMTYVDKLKESVMK